MKNPFHVMHVVHGLDVGGLEIMIYRLVKQLDSARFRASVCCFDTRGALADDFERAGVEVGLLPRMPGIDYRYPLKLAQFLRRRRVDVAHLHSEMGLIYGVPAAHLAGTQGVLYTEHGREFPASPRKTFANRLLAFLDVHVVPVSTTLRDSLITYEHFRMTKMSVIPNGVPDPPRPDTDTLRTFRNEMGAGDEHILLGTIGRLREVKDHLGLIRAMPALLAMHGHVRLAIVGGGLLRDMLQCEIQRLKLEKFVRLIGERKEVAPYVHAFDLFVLSSRSEGLPLSLLEALAAAKPAVAMNVGGVSDVMEDGAQGFLIEPGNYAQFVQRLGWLIDHPQERKIMAQQGRQTYLARFTLERMVAGYTALYERLLARPRTLTRWLQGDAPRELEAECLPGIVAKTFRPVSTMP